MQHRRQGGRGGERCVGPPRCLAVRGLVSALCAVGLCGELLGCLPVVCPSIEVLHESGRAVEGLYVAGVQDPRCTSAGSALRLFTAPDASAEMTSLEMARVLVDDDLSPDTLPAVLPPTESVVPTGRYLVCHQEGNTICVAVAVDEGEGGTVRLHSGASTSLASMSTMGQVGHKEVNFDDELQQCLSFREMYNACAGELADDAAITDCAYWTKADLQREDDLPDGFYGCAASTFACTDGLASWSTSCD